MNAAIAQQVMPPFNPAEHVELAPVPKSKAREWTATRVAHWQHTGQRPFPVMVWTAEQTGAFLDHIAGHRLYALWHLIAFRGLRRGEACGLRWIDLDFPSAMLSVATQLVQEGWVVAEGIPKTATGVRDIPLDAGSLIHLEEHRRRQAAERQATSTARTDTGRVFTEPDGAWLHPGKVSTLFIRLVAEAGLPPVRLHDLRHGAATLMLSAGVNIKVVSETLGHASTHFTRDIYQTVLGPVWSSGHEFGGSPARRDQFLIGHQSWREAISPTSSGP